MDGKMLARLGAVVFVAVAITATAIEMTRKETPPEMGHARAVEPARDPLREVLQQPRDVVAALAQLGELRIGYLWPVATSRFPGLAFRRHESMQGWPLLGIAVGCVMDRLNIWTT